MKREMCEKWKNYKVTKNIIGELKTTLEEGNEKQT